MFGDKYVYLSTQGKHQTFSQRTQTSFQWYMPNVSLCLWRYRTRGGSRTGKPIFWKKKFLAFGFQCTKKACHKITTHEEHPIQYATFPSPPLYLNYD